ncbi:MAG: mitochondrial fission ELM1 family protein [Pseudomonadota bacterium]
MTAPRNNIAYRPQTTWILTDGKAGDRVQCLGVTEAIGLEAEERIVDPGKLAALLMPRWPIPWRHRPGRPSSPINPPFPDLAIATGRRAVAYLRALKGASPRTFTVFLKDPRTGAKTADFIWVPDHDALRGDNVMTTLTSPHRQSRDALSKARAAPHAGIDGLKSPRLTVLVGGDSGNHTFTPDDSARLARHLKSATESGWSLMGSLSRRTDTSGPHLRHAIASVFEETGGYLWDGNGENPYSALLAKADAIIVTADSVNMVGEALATGAHMAVFEPSARTQKRTQKIERFLAALRERGFIHTCDETLESGGQPSFDATPEIAQAILNRYSVFREKHR